MLQAVVLLQRLSLTQHQQQQQQRREQESQPMPADTVRTPVVVLQDISTTAQTGDSVPPKSEEPVMTATLVSGVESEPAEGSSAGPPAKEEADGAGRSVDGAGPSGWTGVAPSAPPEVNTAAAPAEVASNSHSEGTSAAPTDGPEAETGPCQELPPVLTPAEQGEFTMSAEEAAAGERAAEPPPPALSPFPPCGSSGCPAEAADGGGAPPGGEPPPPETILSETAAMEVVPNGEPEATADTTECDDASAVQSDPAQLHNGDTTTSGQNEVAAPESSAASAESERAVPSRSPAPQEEGEPSDNCSTPSSSRKRKAPASLDSPDKCGGSPRSDVEREQSPHSENEQGCRPRRRCAIRTNYALFFAGWNAD